MNNWRLAETIGILINKDRKRVLILPPESNNKVRSKYLTHGRTVGLLGENVVDSPKFHLTVKEDGTLLCSCDSILEGEPVIVENHWDDIMWSIIAQSNISSGKIEEEFEVAFNDNSGKVMFVSQEMKEYDDCFDEMIRRLNVSLKKKKTKKWIPGHRYDDENETLYYLGPILSHRNDDSGSEFVSGMNRVECHLVCRQCRQYKTVTEVLNHKNFTNGLEVLYKLPMRIDVGEFLKNDLDPKEFNEAIMPRMFEEAYNSMVVNDGPLFPDYNDKIYYLFSPLCYSAGDAGEPVGNDRIQAIMKDIAVRLIRKTIVSYWDTNIPACKIGTVVKDTDNVNHVNEFMWRFDTTNLLAPIYYPGLYDYYGIDIKGMISDIIRGFSLNDTVLSDFGKYVEYYPYFFKYRNSEKSSRQCTLDEKTRNSVRRFEPITKISDLYDDPDLRSLLIEMSNKARDSYGLEACHGFTIRETNAGQYVSFVIDLPDILKYKKGVSELPENLKNEIMRTRFKQLQVKVDIGRKIE